MTTKQGETLYFKATQGLTEKYKMEKEKSWHDFLSAVNQVSSNFCFDRACIIVTKRDGNDIVKTENLMDNLDKIPMDTV